MISTVKLAGCVPLDQWNCQQQTAWENKRRAFSHPEEFANGLICPKDGGNLYDTGQKFLQTATSPAKLRVKCMNHGCDFRGERLERINRISD